MHGITQLWGPAKLHRQQLKPQLTLGSLFLGQQQALVGLFKAKGAWQTKALVFPLINIAPSIIHMQKYCFSSISAGSPDICIPALCRGKSITALQGRIPLAHLQQPQLFQHSHYDMNHSTSLHLIIRLSILIYFIFHVQCQRSSLEIYSKYSFIKKIKEKKKQLSCLGLKFWSSRSKWTRLF